MMGLNHTSLTDKVLFSYTQFTFLRIAGAILTTVGAVGFLYGLYDEITVHEKKEREMEAKRLHDEKTRQEFEEPSNVV
uniref:Essential MCU regulator, mitochondrial n=1 Tax=Steinernema glaseri TaxID=37863 RepID=A0A1I8AEL4_9BILA